MCRTSVYVKTPIILLKILFCIGYLNFATNRNKPAHKVFDYEYTPKNSASGSGGKKKLLIKPRPRFEPLWKGKHKYES